MRLSPAPSVYVTLTENEAFNGSGIYLIDGANPTIINSIIWNNTPNASQLDSHYQLNENAFTISYSDIFFSEFEFGNPDLSYMTNFDAIIGDGMIYEDPEFVDPYTNDYRLQSGSECIDGGSPDFPNDIYGTLPDIGARTFHHIFGCNDVEASNYDSGATYDDGCGNDNETCCVFDNDAWYVDNNIGDIGL